LIAPPGFEEEVVAWLEPRVRPLARHIEIDPLGNLLVWLSDPSDPRPRVMLDCHTDEVGFIISHIDDRGFLSFRALGGWDERLLPAQLLAIRTRDGALVCGAIGTPPPHIQSGDRKVIPIDDLRVDIGAGSAAAAQALGVAVGDPATIHYPTRPLGRAGQDDACVLVGKAFDNRAGCAAQLRVLERLAANPPADVAVVASFSSSEEVGLRGAHTAAYRLDPAFAIALEGTVAADVPGVAANACPSRQGDGVAITIADRSLIVPRRLVAFATTLAEQAGLRFQYKQPIWGGTDAGAIHLTRCGIPSIVLSTPCRYIHSPISTLRLDDFQTQVTLAELAVRAAGTWLMPQRG
jgi:endoglucanase